MKAEYSGLSSADVGTGLGVRHNDGHTAGP